MFAEQNAIAYTPYLDFAFSQCTVFPFCDRGLVIGSSKTHNCLQLQLHKHGAQASCNQKQSNWKPLLIVILPHKQLDRFFLLALLSCIWILDRA